jgi:aspartyl protease family protein
VSSFGKLAIVAMVASVSAAVATQSVIMLGPQGPALRAAKMESAAIGTSGTPASATGTSIPKSADGHYWATGNVNGAGTVRFLVDTGATAVALTPADAQRLGIEPSDLHYGANVVTAAGSARAASVKLASLTVAGARLENVDAMVIEKGLDTSLLGMTYLGRLTSFEATRKSLTLHL